jgi:hypothetical protein
MERARYCNRNPATSLHQQRPYNPILVIPRAAKVFPAVRARPKRGADAPAEEAKLERRSRYIF